MQKQIKINKNYIKITLLIFAVITLIGSGLFAAEKEGKADDFIYYIEKTKIPSKKSNKNKKAGKILHKFVPTEVMSADQAVAFPTDI